MAPAEQLYMDAVITPNRSLSKRGLQIVLGAMLVYNILLALLLLAIGAFPVPIFLGLDFVGVLLAFSISNKRALRAERVRVSAETIEVERQQGGKPSTVWSSPTAFTRVAVEDVGETGRVRVELRLSGRVMTVADALSPKERTAFADALQRAIAAALKERHAVPSPSAG